MDGVAQCPGDPEWSQMHSSIPGGSTLILGGQMPCRRWRGHVKRLTGHTFGEGAGGCLRVGHVTTYYEPSHTPQLTTGILSLQTCSPNFLQLKSYNRSRPRRTIFSAAGTGSGPHQRFNNTMSSFIITYNNNQPPVFQI